MKYRYFLKRQFMTEQEKLDILTRDFEKLEENWKDYIWELTRQLVDIHCGGELMGINAVIDSVSI
jgi:hypothetical protein